MKVLKIIHTQGHGGAENTFRWLSWGLLKQGVEVVAAIPEPNGAAGESWLNSAIKELQIPYVTFNKNGTPLQLLKNIDNLVYTIRPDIVHSHLLDSNFYSSLVCRGRSIPHISTEHGDVSLNQTAISRLKYGLISLCSNFIICVSNAIKEKASNVVFVKSKLRTIYNGIQFFSKSVSTFREEFSIPNDALLIGTVGNLYQVKGHKYLITAFSELLKQYSNAYLVIVGRGSEEHSLRQLILELNIPRNRVCITGFRNDIQNILNAVDLYVQPSLSEGHPLAVLEAMSLGIPIIATAVGGVPEILGENRYGMLIPPASSTEIFHAMSDYFSNLEIHRDKAAAAREFALQAFTVECMAYNYVNIYRETLKLSHE